MELQLRWLHRTLQSKPSGQSIVEEAQYPTLLLSALQIMVHDSVGHLMVSFRYSSSVIGSMADRIEWTNISRIIVIVDSSIFTSWKDAT